MKKLLTLFALALICMTSSATSDAELFSYDDAKINHELKSLNQLELAVLSGNQTQVNVLTAELNLIPNQAAGKFATNFSFSDMDWGAWAWGFCCWPVGIFTVLLNDSKGTESRISYFIGIGTSIILSGVSWTINTIYGIR